MMKLLDAGDMKTDMTGVLDDKDDMNRKNDMMRRNEMTRGGNEDDTNRRCKRKRNVKEWRLVRKGEILWAKDRCHGARHRL